VLFGGHGSGCVSRTMRSWCLVLGWIGFWVWWVVWVCFLGVAVVVVFAWIVIVFGVFVVWLDGVVLGKRLVASSIICGLDVIVVRCMNGSVLCFSLCDRVGYCVSV